jgi:hypothetical protein
MAIVAREPLPGSSSPKVPPTEASTRAGQSSGAREVIEAVFEDLKPLALPTLNHLHQIEEVIQVKHGSVVRHGRPMHWTISSQFAVF